MSNLIRRLPQARQTASIVPALAAAAATLLPLAAQATLPESELATGDLIILRATADGLTPVLADEQKAAGETQKGNFKAPARTKLKVNRDDKGQLTVVIKDNPCDPEDPMDPANLRSVGADPATVSTSPTARTAAASRRGAVHPLTAVTQSIGTIKVTPADCATSPMVVEGHSYTMAAEHLDQFGFRRLGFVYGGLIIPYKYFHHDRSLEPGTTIGPFLGYRFGQTGWGISLIVTYGVSDIKVRVKDGNELKERTFFGLSRGVGFMFDITKSDTPFRAGVLWGRDRIGSNNVDVYPHDGKTWVAAQLGWEFGR